MVAESPINRPYRGRIAPSPTGFLHLGHARTFWYAQERARQRGGTLVLRNEDLDVARCKPQFVAAMFEDLSWFGLHWQEGSDCGGPHAPYDQSKRTPLYEAALETLLNKGLLYACICSRKDIQNAASAPHLGDDGIIYPGTCRPKYDYRKQQTVIPGADSDSTGRASAKPHCWRFKVPPGEIISFTDGNYGPQQFEAGVDFGDFVVWRQDNVPAYQLAVVVDDAAMQITEVVRGADLLLSTARQLLLYRALGLKAPAFYHCALLTDASGTRLAKRCDALSLQNLRVLGETPGSFIKKWRMKQATPG